MARLQVFLDGGIALPQQTLQLVGLALHRSNSFTASVTSHREILSMRGWTRRGYSTACRCVRMLPFLLHGWQAQVWRYCDLTRKQAR